MTQKHASAIGMLVNAADHLSGIFLLPDLPIGQGKVEIMSCVIGRKARGTKPKVGKQIEVLSIFIAKLIEIVRIGDC